jgi:hypothetical protein
MPTKSYRGKFAILHLGSLDRPLGNFMQVRDIASFSLLGKVACGWLTQNVTSH